MLCLCLAGLVDSLHKETTAYIPDLVEILEEQSLIHLRSGLHPSSKDEVEGGYEPRAAAGLPLRGVGLLRHHLHTVVFLLRSWQQLGTISPDQGALSKWKTSRALQVCQQPREAGGVPVPRGGHPGQTV